MTKDEKQLLKSLHRKDRYACNEMVEQLTLFQSREQHMYHL